jgi:hypothetical protein
LGCFEAGALAVCEREVGVRRWCFLLGVGGWCGFWGFGEVFGWRFFAVFELGVDEYSNNQNNTIAITKLF